MGGSAALGILRERLPIEARPGKQGKPTSGTSMNPTRPLFLLALAALGSAPAAAQDVYLGSRTTAVSRNDFLDGTGSLVGACGGIVQSMTELGGEIFIGDQNGNVYRHTPSTSAFGYAFTSDNDATSLAVHNGDLLVGGGDGTLLRYDPSTGVKKATLSASGLPIQAMVVIGDTVIVGSISGLIQSGHALNGGFQFWGSCGNTITALASDGTDLFAADEGERIWRFDVATKSLVHNFQVASEVGGMALIGGDLVIGSIDNNVRRLDHATGALKSSFATFFPIDALTVNQMPEPGASYCFGTACPCGNNDPENGCVNSSGFGSGLVATGSASVSADNLEIAVYDLPAHVMGRFYMSPLQSSMPFGNGMLCTGGSGYPTFRLNFGSTGGKGILRAGPGIAAYAVQHIGPSAQIFPGSTWHFQGWFRDLNGPCGSSFNTTSAYTVNFLP